MSWVINTENNIDGENNIFLGYRSGFNNTTAGDNVIIGNWAGYYNTTGTKNTLTSKRYAYAKSFR